MTIDYEAAESENVIAVDFAADRPAFSIKKKRDHTCEHRVKSVDEVLRVVVCRDCDVELDPITVIIGISRRWDRLQNNIDDIKAKAKRKRSELEKVKIDLRNAKARLRRTRAAIDAESQ